MFSIEIGDVAVPRHCPLLMIPLKLNNAGCAKPNSPTLDCIIPALGYVKGNVWVISHRANTIKSDASVAEIALVARNLRKRLS
jgi:hypothetical protein